MDISSDTAKGSAMLQIHAAPSGDVKGEATPSHVTDSLQQEKSRCSFGSLESTYLLESQHCLPNGLQEAHLQALRRHAALLSTKERKPEALMYVGAQAGADHFYAEDYRVFTVGDEIIIGEGTATEESNVIKKVEYAGQGAPDAYGKIYTTSPITNQQPWGTKAKRVVTATAASSSSATATVSLSAASATVAASSSDPDAETASLDAAGFKLITSLCCPTDMETFFNRLLASRGLQVCSKAHIQGLMHWFSCIPDMDFNYLLDIINNGNPCKYWAPIGSTCAALSPECQGKWCR